MVSQDIVEEENAKIITESQYTVKSRSLIILISVRILTYRKVLNHSMIY